MRCKELCHIDESDVDSAWAVHSQGKDAEASHLIRFTHQQTWRHNNLNCHTYRCNFPSPILITQRWHHQNEQCPTCEVVASKHADLGTTAAHQIKGAYPVIKTELAVPVNSVFKLWRLLALAYVCVSAWGPLFVNKALELWHHCSESHVIHNSSTTADGHSAHQKYKQLVSPETRPTWVI